MKALQLKFLDALSPTLEQDLASWIVDGRLDASSQMAIYKGSVQGGLLGVLRATYPVCCRLVGNDYFGQLAQEYIKQTVHSEPDITNYGKDFTRYIHATLPLHQLCYLADVAAIEWASHLALNGLFVEKLDQAALACVGLEQQPNLTFALAECSTLLYSRYPVLRIWQVNQADQEGEVTVSLDEGETHLLVYRLGDALKRVPLTEQTFKMLTYFSKGDTFEVVCQKCIEEYPSLDIPRLFAECIQNEYLVSFDIAAA